MCSVVYGFEQVAHDNKCETMDILQRLPCGSIVYKVDSDFLFHDMYFLILVKYVMIELTLSKVSFDGLHVLVTISVVGNQLNDVV